MILYAWKNTFTGDIYQGRTAETPGDLMEASGIQATASSFVFSGAYKITKVRRKGDRLIEFQDCHEQGFGHGFVLSSTSIDGKRTQLTCQDCGAAYETGREHNESTRPDSCITDRGEAG